MTEVVLVSPGPTAPIWGLGPLRPKRGEVVLIGWTGDGSTIDAGIPALIALSLSRALCAVWRLSFRLASADAERLRSMGLVEQGQVRTRGLGMADRLWQQDQASVSTVDATGVLAFLADPGWSLGGQVAILTDCTKEAPTFRTQDFAEFTDDDWLDHVSSLPDVEGALRPGIDGDVAGLFLTRAAARQFFIAELRKQAEASGVAIRELPEEDLRRCLAQAS